MNTRRTGYSTSIVLRSRIARYLRAGADEAGSDALGFRPRNMGSADVSLAVITLAPRRFISSPTLLLIHDLLDADLNCYAKHSYV